MVLSLAVMGEILKLAIDWMDVSGETPPIPETETFCLVRLRQRDCTSHSEINDADEPLSRRALKPSSQYNERATLRTVAVLRCILNSLR